MLLQKQLHSISLEEMVLAKSDMLIAVFFFDSAVKQTNVCIKKKKTLKNLNDFSPKLSLTTQPSHSHHVLHTSVCIFKNIQLVPCMYNSLEEILTDRRHSLPQ